MFDAPYGGALPQNAQGGGPQGIMQMLASMFKNMGGGQGPGGFMSMKPQGLMSMVGGQQPQQPPQQGMAPSVNSGVNKILDPNSQLMSALAGKAPAVDPSRTIGAPISNDPSTNMQNGGVPPFNNMQWQR